MAIGAAFSLLGSMTQGVAAQAAGERLKTQAEKLDRDGAEARGKGWTQNRLANASLPKPKWPKPGLYQAQNARAAAGARADDLPVRIAARQSDDVSVEVIDREKIPTAWRDGLLLRLAGDTTDTATVSVDYNAFRYASGGGWASRLRLWLVPECALTSPERPECSTVPLETANDLKMGTASADVHLSSRSLAPRSKGELAGDQSAPSGSGAMVLLAAGPSGSSGDFTATSLQPSSTWSAGGSSGDFSWSYPMRMPPAAGGPAPSITIGYSSSSVDGRSAASNNQPSWIGEGFEYSPGYIERRYVPCAEDMEGGASNTEKTGDLCWRSDNATMSLNGSGGELIYEAGKGWHSRSEDGAKIEKLSGASNGDNDGEYWKVTTTDGTQYFFGRNTVPGQSAGTNSALNVPVFGNHSGEPCRQSSFASSYCAQTWRWNVDYVVDARGNTMSYWYDRETNQYARNATDADNIAYDRAGVLKRIDYGTYYRTSAEHGRDEVAVSPFAQVVFTTADRCLVDCWNGSEPVAENWPDTPHDQTCKLDATSCPQQYSPTFWTTKRLSKITTRIWDTTKATPAWQDVDSWTLTHAFPSPGDGTHPGLWLDSIVHTGHVGANSALPPVTFEPVSLPNRVLTAHDTTNNWMRLSNIVTESGARIHVDYSLPECTDTNKPANAHTNSMRCYPVLVPDLSADPTGETLRTEWWHKYVVTHVAEDDVQLSGGHQSVSKHSWYEYVGAPAWHYADDDGLVKPKYKTWSQFRGYGTVKIRTGNDPATQTLQVMTFMRGMHGDRANPAGDTRTVTVLASIGSETVYDEDQFAGMVREQAVYNGSESKPVSKTVTVPWRSNPTASRTINGDTVESRFTSTKMSYTAIALGVDGARGWRTSRVEQDLDHTYGMVNWSRDDGDIALPDDEKCTTYTYNRNPAKHIVGTVKRVAAVALPCDEAPSSADNVLSDVRHYYDGASSVDTAPLYGGLTKVEMLKDWTVAAGTVWQTVAQTTFDASGRPITATDIKGNTTSTVYTPAVGGPLTKVSTTAPAPYNWVTTVDIAPYWGASYKSTDPNGKITGEAVYDALGRVSKVWDLGWPRASQPTIPSREYTYSFPANRDSYPSIRTRELNAKGNYVTSYQILDGLLRQRQTQSLSLNGDGNRVVADTIYDEHGRVAASYAAHAEPGAPSGNLWWEPEWSVSSVVKNAYDRASRPIASIFYSGDGVTNLVEKWRTSFAYEGDLTKTTPPNGAVPTTVVTDIAGRTVAIRKHTTAAGVGGAYDETSYQYNRKDQLTKVVGPAGNEWVYTYDVKGRPKTVTDPDSGETTSDYNDANELIKTTDARGEVLFHIYDQLGRPTQLRDDSATGALRAEWKYDTLYSGQGGFRGNLTQAIRYEPAGSSNAYKWQVRQMNGRYQPSGINIVIPPAESGLNATYVYQIGYSTYTGAPTSLTYPAIGDLPTETVTTDYDSLTGLPVRLDTNRTGQAGTMLATWYTAFGETSLTTKKMPGGVYVDDSTEYDPYTRRIARTAIKPETASGNISDRTYTYDQAGNVKSIKDAPQVGVADTQCFRYDELVRLKSAWTPKAGVDCGTDPTVTNLGGPAPYWTDWTFDKEGNRKTEVSHASGGDTTKTYTVPAGGAGVVRPHAVTAVTTGSVTTNYSYDVAGNMTCRPSGTTANSCPTGSGSQVLAWNAEGKLEKVTNGSTTVETNVYDAAGLRLVRRDAAGTTIYLPGQEIRREGTVNKGTRYYSFNGQVVGSRNGSGLTWLYSDHQGTQQIAVQSDSQTVSVRRQTPYGTSRGTQPTWANQKGFVGGDKDPTGLINIGARHYDAGLGRFISDDPITDIRDSQQMNGYAYSNNNPVTLSDPSGLIPTEGNGDAPETCNAKCQADGAKAELDRIKADIDKAKKLKEQSFTDILIQEGLSLLLDMLGITDIVNCFTKGDLGACGSMILSALPVGRIFKMGKAIWKAVERGFSAYKAWKKAMATADAILSKADEALAAAKSKLDNALSKLDDAAESCVKHSFDPDTPVLMGDGSTKPIRDVDIGDEVTATNPETGQTTARTVTRTFINLDEALTDLTIQLPDGSTEVIETTQHHPFWDATEREWVPASELDPGHELHTADGSAVTVVAVRNFSGLEEMRDLTVDTDHTYYVLVGAIPVLVHNCDPIAANGAALDNISAADAAKIQAAADKVGKPIHLVGSRAAGKAGPESDWDYVVTGANSKVKDKIKWLAPSGVRTGQGKGLDIFTGPLQDDLPYITFMPKALCGCK